MSDTGSMWINMLGLGPLFSTINDPAFQLHIRQIVESIGDTAERCKRIEAKLDLLLMEREKDGWDHVKSIPIGIANLSAELGPAGSGGPTAASGTFDDGTGHGQASAESDAGRLRGGNGQDRTLAT
jgi:hypothetical protein